MFRVCGCKYVLDTDQKWQAIPAGYDAGGDEKLLSHQLAIIIHLRCAPLARNGAPPFCANG